MTKLNKRIEKSEYLDYISGLLNKNQETIESLGWKKVRYCKNQKDLHGVKYHFRCSECGWNIVDNGSEVNRFMADGIAWCPMCGCEVSE